MEEELMEDFEEKRKKVEAKSEMLESMLDMLAKVSGSEKMKMASKFNKLHNKVHRLIIDDKIDEEQGEKIFKLVEQFEKLIDDVLKEEK